MMNDDDYEKVFLAATGGNSVHINPVDRGGLVEWAKKNGKVGEDKLTRLMTAYDQKSGEANLPMPVPGLGYPLKGFYEEIYSCLVSENDLSAAILSSIMVEYMLKASVFSLSKSSIEFSRTDWGDLGLDEKTFGVLLQMLKGKISADLYERLNSFKNIRNNLAHANLIKTQGERNIKATIVYSGRVDEVRQISAAELPSIAWEMFLESAKHDSIGILREADSLVGELAAQVKACFS